MKFVRIVVDINHPAQVHFFKYFIWEMQRRGHEILITASEKDLTKYLLTKYDFNCYFLRGYGDSLIKKIINVPIINLEMYRSIKDFQPDLFLGFGSIRATQVAKLMGRPCINFDDDEYSYPYYRFFADAICGFSGFRTTGPRVLKVNGFKEIAYLHPSHFKPNPAVLEAHGISPAEKFSLVRFVSWNAFHDIGRKGFNSTSKINLIKELNEYSSVFISSEAPLPVELERYQLSIPPEYIHDLLRYATLLVSDSQTMTTEAAVLGTPAVRSNSFVGKNDMGNFIELEENYKLIFNCESNDKALNAAVSVINMPNAKAEWEGKRSKLLKEKIDVTAFMAWFIENYPRSFAEMKEHPENQFKFGRGAI